MGESPPMGISIALVNEADLRSETGIVAIEEDGGLANAINVKAEGPAGAK